MGGGFVLLFRRIVPDDRRLFIRFRTSGGSAYVWERKTPRKRAGFRHPSRERASFRQSSRERANFRHIVPDDRRLFIRFRASGGSAYVWERKTPRERAGFRHPSRERASFRQSSRERANFRHIVPDDRRLFIRFRTSGGSAYVWERKTPRERANFRRPSRERASFRHSFEARGQMGSEGSDGKRGVRRRPRPKTRVKKVSPGAHISEMWKKRLCPFL